MKRIIAGLTTALLALGLSLVAFAAPAIAHTPSVTGVAHCQSDGTYTVTWTYTTQNVPDGKQAKSWVSVAKPTPSTLGGKGTGTFDGKFWISTWQELSDQYPGVAVIVANGQTSFTQSGIAASETKAKVKIETKWNDDFSQSADGWVDLAEGCGAPPPACDDTNNGDTSSRHPGNTPDCTPPTRVAADATATDQSCVDGDASDLNSGYLSFGSSEHVTYSINGEAATEDEVKARPGTYTVTAVADDGYVLDGPGTWELVIDDSNCAQADVPVVSGNAGVCDADGDLGDSSWSIELELSDNVRYFINDEPTDEASNPVDAGTYTVRAEAVDGFVLTGEDEFEVVVGDGADVDCSVPVTPVTWTATAAAVQQSCPSVDGGNGAIVVVYPAGDESAVRYFVTAAAVVPAVSTELTAAHTAVAPGDYTVTATSRDATQAIVGTSSWKLVVQSAPANCLELVSAPLLAETGAPVSGGLLLSGALVLLGAAGIYLRRRSVGVAE